MNDELNPYPGNLRRHEVLLNDERIKKMVEKWVATAKDDGEETHMVEVVVCDPPYPASLVRDFYEVDRAKKDELIQRLVDVLDWYVKEDDVMEGGEWDEMNAPWIEGRNEAEKVLADAAEQGFKPTEE